MDRELILGEIKEYLEVFFSERFKEENFPFHNLRHTKAVVEQAIMLAKEEGVTEHELFLIQVAAWFHDTGYAVCFSGHEEESFAICREFLKDKLPDDDYASIEKMILATRVHCSPQSKLEAIVCDSDYYHFHAEDFLIHSMKLREELQLTLKQKFPKQYYYYDTVRFLRSHRYATQYGKDNYEELKQKNVVKVEALLNDSKKKGKEQSTGRGIESMLRLTARNQINLSSIADNKANILLSITSLIVSFSATVGYNQAVKSKEMLVPLIILIVSCLVALIFAILSTRPNVSSGVFDMEDVRKQKVNLLFFGNFYKMDYKEYQDAVREMMPDYDYLYNTMIRDQYSLGTILARKFKLLRIAYTVFMVGITLAVIVFVAAIVLGT